MSSPDSSPDLSIHDFLPEWLGDYAEAVAIELQVPADAVSTLALGAISAAINGSAQSEVVEGWIEPVNMANTRLVVLLPALRATLVTDDDTKGRDGVNGLDGRPGCQFRRRAAVLGQLPAVALQGLGRLQPAEGHG